MADEILAEEPQKPGDSECCGGGSCCPCVWDLYYEQMQLWREQQARLAQSVGDEASTTDVTDAE